MQVTSYPTTYSPFVRQPNRKPAASMYSAPVTAPPEQFESIVPFETKDDPMQSLGGAYKPNFDLDDPTGAKNNFRTGGGLTRPLSPQEAELAKMKNADQNMQYMADRFMPSPAKPPAAPAPTGSFLDQMLAMLGGGGGIGGSSSTSAQSGDTNLTQQKGDTFGSFTNLINELLRTAMGGKTAGDKNATDYATSRLGANTQSQLAGLGSKESRARMGWVGDAFANMNPGFKPATVPVANEIDLTSLDQGVPTDQIYGGGIGGADPLGLLGIRPKKTSAEMANALGNSRSIKPMQIA